MNKNTWFDKIVSFLVKNGMLDESSEYDIDDVMTALADNYEPKASDDQIKNMVDRFLVWKLPDDFSPDGGISFKPDFNEHTDHPMKHEPTGTNLLDARQAEAMIRHMIDAA